MTWNNRFRLLGGVLGVILFTLALALVFNHRQNQVSSYTGQVNADTYSIGADHAGTVVRQFVDEGDSVTAGEELFQVQSLQLKQDIANGLEVSDTPAYNVDAKRGIITYYAVSAGTIEELNARQGNSVPAGGALAKLYGGDRYLEASFHLAPRDYARVVPGAEARVVLPNDQVITASVTKVSVANSVDGTVATLKLDSPQLLTLTQPTLSEPGTPVVVNVQLVDSGPLAPVTDAVNDLLQQVGLR
ncbi:MAG: HlyD family efflux transporter periplasmic adaptor subunit [Propionibacteriaceae bacterium]|nr:HlyD family efflux transporter periplasmic adaptor subunit [Propionibacteriaceae bacterium]